MRLIAGDDRTPWQDVFVLCDGVKVRHCLAADTEAGVALSQPHDESGNPIFTADGRRPALPEVVRGTITLQLNEQGRERWESVEQLMEFYAHRPHRPDRTISLIRRLNAAIRQGS